MAATLHRRLAAAEEPAGTEAARPKCGGAALPSLSLAAVAAGVVAAAVLRMVAPAARAVSGAAL
jgi:hypothetical protein